jgi:hypothetical protein
VSPQEGFPRFVLCSVEAADLLAGASFNPVLGQQATRDHEIQAQTSQIL